MFEVHRLDGSCVQMIVVASSNPIQVRVLDKNGRTDGSSYNATIECALEQIPVAQLEEFTDYLGNHLDPTPPSDAMYLIGSWTAGKWDEAISLAEGLVAAAKIAENAGRILAVIDGQFAAVRAVA